MSRKRTITGVGDYAFKDKDPIIDILRTLVQIESALRRVRFWAVIRQISKDTGISVSCFYGWFDGTTVSPRFSYVQAVALWFDVPVTMKGLPVKSGWSRAYKASHRPHVRIAA